ncbi:MAG: acylphosphatase [Lachnospiraceae bacterium]|nr:acylphosphatase [Lachnospiraceae bacterium]
MRKNFKINGFVQGVGFRYRAVHAANAVCATGWVRNNPDGSVSMEIQGTEEQMNEIFRMIAQGSWVSIDSVEAKEIPEVEDERSFGIIYD